MVSEHFADDYLPVYDISDAVAVVVEAERQKVWEALLEADPLDVGCSLAVGMLGAIRILPDIIGHLLHGEPPDKAPESRLHILRRCSCSSLSVHGFSGGR